jgi:flagellar basal body-associated protein FliL
MQKDYSMKKTLILFIITALLIIAGAMAYQAYTHGAFKDAHGSTPIPEPDVESH